MNPREAVIGLSLLVPTLVIGFWPRLAINLYEASTTALATSLTSQAQVALSRMPALG